MKILSHLPVDLLGNVNHYLSESADQVALRSTCSAAVTAFDAAVANSHTKNAGARAPPSEDERTWHWFPVGQGRGKDVARLHALYLSDVWRIEGWKLIETALIVLDTDSVPYWWSTRITGVRSIRFLRGFVEVWDGVDVGPMFSPPNFRSSPNDQRFRADAVAARILCVYPDTSREAIRPPGQHGGVASDAADGSQIALVHLTVHSGLFRWNDNGPNSMSELESGLECLAQRQMVVIHLDLHKWPGEGVCRHPLVMSSCTLQHLNLGGTHVEINDDLLTNLTARNCDALRHLVLSHVRSVSERGVMAAIVACPLLEHLDVSFTRCSLDRVIPSLSVHCPKLRRLVVDSAASLQVLQEFSACNADCVVFRARWGFY
jgi:hypothetical protein